MLLEIKTGNEGYGFHGEARSKFIRDKHGSDAHSPGEADHRKAVAFANKQFNDMAKKLVAGGHFSKLTHARDYLDSSHGRHLHDEIADHGYDLSKSKWLMKSVRSFKSSNRLNEAGKVYSVGGPAEKRGAPSGPDRARAFDKVNPKTGARPNRSVLHSMAKAASQDQDYSATDISEDPDYTMVLVVGGQTEPYLATGEEYYGVNVLFYPTGKIEASTADSAADWQWKHHKAQIIAAAKRALKKHGVDIYRGGKPVKESKLSFKQFLLNEGVDDRRWFKQKKDWQAAVAKVDVDDDGVNVNGDCWARCDGKLVAKWFDDSDEGWVDDSHMKPVKEAKVTEPGWYVCKNDEPVDGPMTEREAKKAAEEKGDAYCAEYYTDYQVRRMNEGKKGKFGVKLGGVYEEKPEVGFEDRLNFQKAQSECKDAGIKFKTTSNFGIHYMIFDSQADQKKAVRLIKKVIDKSVESEWS